VGQIGDGIFKPSSHLTISTAQTLHSRYDFLERTGFFDEFSFLCLDECHHATAETYNRLVDRFSSKIRIGVSATPDKTGDFALATNVLGPIFHTTPRKDVSILVEPHIFKIPTNFRFGYRSAQGRTPSNYGNLIKALVADHERNELIVLSVLLNEEGHSLVVSKRLEHLAILSEMLRDYGYRGQILTLTGKESSDERKRVVRQATEEPCVVFSTLADEALDIPRLDRLFLVFPQRNPGLITQQVGRVARVHPDKQDARVFDFADLKVGPLENQWRIRRLQVYQPNHYPVTVVRPEDIIEYEPAA
jgi:superfamily II DNA or RNA helicase